jgi:hypothetical protein
MSKPWDRPPFPKTGDASDDITYAAVGRALSQCENFELDLAGIFSLVVGTAKGRSRVVEHMEPSSLSKAARTA